MYVCDLIFFNSMLVSIILVLVLCLICIMAKPKMQICLDYHVSKGLCYVAHECRERKQLFNIWAPSTHEG